MGMFQNRLEILRRQRAEQPEGSSAAAFYDAQISHLERVVAEGDDDSRRDAPAASLPLNGPRERYDTGVEG